MKKTLIQEAIAEEHKKLEFLGHEVGRHNAILSALQYAQKANDGETETEWAPPETDVKTGVKRKYTSRRKKKGEAKSWVEAITTVLSGGRSFARMDLAKAALAERGEGSAASSGVAVSSALRTGLAEYDSEGKVKLA